MSETFKMFVAGEWRDSAHKNKVCNPYNGETVALVAQATPRDAEDAVAAAQKAFPRLKALASYQRAELIQKTVSGMEQRREELAQTITAEAAKPIRDARREVERSISTFQVAAEETKRLEGQILPLDWTNLSAKKMGLLRRFPIGPILGITPFNFPLNLVVHKVAPALASSNPILIRPASQTPLSALKLAQIIEQAGWPAGALSVLPCDYGVVEQLLADPRIKKLTFTGSPNVGWKLKEKASRKKVTLELGGNGGVIVHSDADLDFAAQRCASGGYVYSGQTCISVQRIFVQESVYPAFTAQLLTRVKELVSGDPCDEQTHIGPLIDEAAAKRVELWIQEAVSGGAQVLTGGRRKGSFIEPTVLANVQPQMKVNRIEVFGPLVTVAPYKDFDEAVRSVDDSRYGLQAGVFTRDLDRIFHAYQNLEVGAVIANDVPTFRADHMPYGGVKDSGTGREGIRYAMEEMTELRLLVVNGG